jgi:hypothetical protein
MLPGAYDRSDGEPNPIRHFTNLNEAGSLTAIIYLKAPVMRQLELLLGADRFRDGVRRSRQARIRQRDLERPDRSVDAPSSRSRRMEPGLGGRARAAADHVRWIAPQPAHGDARGIRSVQPPDRA